MPRRGSQDVEIAFTSTGPNPKQERFLTATNKYVCYGGARGGGKTWSVIAKSTLLALNYPGIKILIMRRKYTQLYEMLIQPMCRMIPDVVGEYTSSVYTFFFYNGSTIKFGHLNDKRALDDYQGKEYDIVFIDEATQFAEDEFRTLGACLRAVNDYPKRFYLTCNPGGIGHQWVKRLFIDRNFRRDKEHPENDENPDDYLFIPATVYDNKVMLEHSPDYVKQLNLLPEKIRKAHRDGDWNALGGQFFEEFDPKVHVVDSFPIPAGWGRYRVIDYGLDMLAVLWVAVDYKGRSYVYREYQMGKDLEGGRGLTVSEAADAIKEHTLQSENIPYTIAPPDVWSTQKDTGKIMADVFFENGVPLVRANNSRVQGWMMLKEALSPSSVDGIPMLQIMSNCPQLIENLPMLQTSEKNPNDCDTEPHNITHICDALRYYVQSRTMKPEEAQSMPEPSIERAGHAVSTYEDYLVGGEPDDSYLSY
nr:phage terminase large subunit [Papillibacter cinnamivorans]